METITFAEIAERLAVTCLLIFLAAVLHTQSLRLMNKSREPLRSSFSQALCNVGSLLCIIHSLALSSAVIALGWQSMQSDWRSENWMVGLLLMMIAIRLWLVMLHQWTDWIIAQGGCRKLFAEARRYWCDTATRYRQST